jgi:ubiquinone/menaquinone biosynthesis C-methylase UbiE
LEIYVRRHHWTLLAGQPVPTFDKEYAIQSARTFYDAIAYEYDQRNSPALLRTHEQVIRSIKATVDGRQNPAVLDLGGGTGKLVAQHFFDSADLRWVYVDESPQMASQFKNNLASTKLNKTTQIEEIAEYLRAAVTDQFDVIVLSLVLTSMEKNPDWAAIAARLAPHGRVIVAEIDAAYTALNPHYIVNGGKQRHALKPRLVPLTEILHQAHAAGLKLVTTTPITQSGLTYSFVAELAK